MKKAIPVNLHYKVDDNVYGHEIDIGVWLRKDIEPHLELDLDIRIWETLCFRFSLHLKCDITEQVQEDLNE